MQRRFKINENDTSMQNFVKNSVNNYFPGIKLIIENFRSFVDSSTRITAASLSNFIDTLMTDLQNAIPETNLDTDIPE